MHTEKSSWIWSSLVSGYHIELKLETAIKLGRVKKTIKMPSYWDCKLVLDLVEKGGFTFIVPYINFSKGWKCLGLKGLSGLLKTVMPAFPSFRNKIQIMTSGGLEKKKG